MLRRAPTSTLLTYGPTGPDLPGGGRWRPPRTAASIEVIDLRSLSPLDMDADRARRSRRTGRVRGRRTRRRSTRGLGAEIAARVTEQCFYYLEAPVLRVGGFATPYPPSRLEEHYLPDLDRILDAVDRTFGY